MAWCIFCFFDMTVCKFMSSYSILNTFTDFLVFSTQIKNAYFAKFAVSKILCISKSPRYFCGFSSVHSYSRNLTFRNLGEPRASFTFLTRCNQLLWPARPIITVTIRSGLEAFTPTNPLLTQRIITSCDNFTTTPDPLTRSTPRTYSLRYWLKI